MIGDKKTYDLSGMGMPYHIHNGVDAPQISSKDLLNTVANESKVYTIATDPTPIPNIGTYNMYIITAQATAAAFQVPVGTPQTGQKLIIRIKDDGSFTSLLTFDAIYRAGTSPTLPATTVLGKNLYLGFIYNYEDSRWDLVAKTDEI